MILVLTYEYFAYAKPYFDVILRVNAKINERKTNKKIEHDELLLRTVYLYKIIFRKLNKKKRFSEKKIKKKN